MFLGSFSSSAPAAPWSPAPDHHCCRQCHRNLVRPETIKVTRGGRHRHVLCPAERELQSASCSSLHTWQLQHSTCSARLIPAEPGLRWRPATDPPHTSIVIDRQPSHFTSQQLTSPGVLSQLAHRRSSSIYWTKISVVCSLQRITQICLDWVAVTKCHWEGHSMNALVSTRLGLGFLRVLFVAQFYFKYLAHVTGLEGVTKLHKWNHSIGKCSWSSSQSQTSTFQWILSFLSCRTLLILVK